MKLLTDRRDAATLDILFLLSVPSLIVDKSNRFCQQYKRRSSGAMSTRQEDLELELRDVILALKDVAGTQWYDLGLQLRLSPSILDTIAAHHNADDHKRMMLRKWLQSDPEASWERLAAALALIGHSTTAANVRSQFVKIAVQAMADTVTQTEEDEIRVALAQSNLQKIKGQFSALLHKAQSALESYEVKVDAVYDFLVRYFSRNDWIQSPSTFGELFNVLSVVKLWNYDHYGPLELIVTHFLSDSADIEACMTDYISKLTGFYTATKIADFIKLSDFEDSEQDPKQLLPVGNFTLKDYRRLKLKLKLSRKVSALALSYVDELWRSLAKQFDLPCLTAVIHSIVQGSLEVTWLVLPHITEKIIANSRNSEAVKFFRHHGIILAEIDDSPVYDEEQMVEREKQLFEICWKNINVSNIGELVACGVDLNTFYENSQSPLYIAIGMDHFEIAKELLRYGAQVNLANNSSFGDVPLTIACGHGNVDIATILIDKGAVVNFQNKSHGNSPLHVTCENNHPHIARLLLERGAQVNMLNKKGISALSTSSWKGYVEIVKVLLEFGAQVNLPNNDEYGDTALIEACRGGHVETARVLLDHGANVDYQNKEGKSSLFISSEGGNVEIVKILLEHEAQVNVPGKDEYGDTALIEACRGGHVETARILLDHGANVDYQNKEGKSSLFISSEGGNVEIVKILLEHGAQVNVLGKDGWRPLTWACHNGHSNVVELLLHYGANVNQQNDTEQGETPLTCACWEGHINTAKVLVENGAIVDLVSKNGQSPLYLACTYRETAAMIFLLEHGADTNLPTQDERAFTALSTACYDGNIETVRVLLEHGKPNIDYQTPENGWTALMIAVDGGHINIVKLLIDHGAAISLRSKAGLTALDLANTQDTRELLLEQFAELEACQWHNTVTENKESQVKVETVARQKEQANKELTEEQKQEVKSVRKRARKMLERMFLREQLKKKEYLKKQQQENEEKNSGSLQPNIPEHHKVRILFGRVRRRQRIVGRAPVAE